MLRRITTWLTRLAIVVELGKLVKSMSRAAKDNRLAAPWQQPRFALPWQQRRFPAPWQRRSFAFPWEQRRASRMNVFRPLVLGLGLGAVLMYLFDTRMGNRRRALVRDQVVHLSHETEEALDKASRDLKNRAAGVVAQAQKSPLRQGGSQGSTGKPELLQENWSPGVRVLGAVAGTALAASTFTLRGAPRVAGGALGLGLLARSVTNIPVKRLVGVRSGRRAVDIQKAINIGAPVEEVFNFYSNFENFPRFMANVREVRDLGEGRSRWVAEGPAGISAQWDARLTRFEPDRMIAWSSEEGSMVGNAGTVRFDPTPNGGTRVTVRMSYNPPAGALGHAVATLFNSNPKQSMNEDLVRLKSLIETDKTTAEGQKVRREEFEIGQGTELRSGGDRQGSQQRQAQGQAASRSDERSVERGRERASESARESRETEIPLGEWEEFCETFGQQHAGWLVTVETQYPNGSQSTIATDQPLRAISSERHDGAIDLRVVLGDDANEQLAHTVSGAESLYLRSNEQGVHEGLRIRSADAMTTVRFRSPAPPEMVNGLP